MSAGERQQRAQRGLRRDLLPLVHRVRDLQRVRACDVRVDAPLATVLGRRSCSLRVAGTGRPAPGRDQYTSTPSRSQICVTISDTPVDGRLAGGDSEGWRPRTRSSMRVE